MAAINEILVIPHTHHDVGYTHTPNACLAAHAAGIGEAVRLCEADLADSSPTAFHWTVEVARPLVEYLRQATPAKIERLRRVVAAGRLAITGAYYHMTQLVGHEDAVRLFQPVRELRERYGLPVSIVQHGDVNGISWGMVPLIRAAGLDCLVMALNPDHGLPPFEQPATFIWEGQDGSRLLTWLSVHYGLGDLNDRTIDQVEELLLGLVARSAARADYPFEFVVVHAARDNMWPNRRAVEAVREWNARGLRPPMRLATIGQAMARVREQTARTPLPVVRGEWADWWAHGHGSAAYEVGLGRQAQTDLAAAEAIAATAGVVAAATPAKPIDTSTRDQITSWYSPPVLPALTAPQADRMREAYDQLLLEEEHTWSSWESVSNPFSEFTRTHWNESAAFAYRAFAQARDLKREAVERLVAALPSASESSLVVVNPLSWRRDDVITIEADGAKRRLVVRDLPPFGAKVLPAPAEQPNPAAPTSSTIVENSFYRLEVDPARASAIHLYDKELGREWIDSAALAGLAGVVYEEADPSDEHPALRVHRNRFHPNNPGPRFIRTAATGSGTPHVEQRSGATTITYEGAAPYLPLIRTSIALYDEVKWIDVTVHLRKEENYAMEGVFILFPFALAAPQFVLETTNAVYQPDIEQLPDTCRDWYSVQHGAAVSDGEATVLWATREAPLVQLGGLHTGKWSRQFPVTSGHINSWLMNNLYFTNFRAAQGGELDFSYRLTTRPGGLDRAAVWRWGEEFAATPPVRQANVQPGDYQWLDIAPETVAARVATSATPRPGLLLRLKETSGMPTTATIRWQGSSPARLFRTDLLDTETRQPIEGDGRSFAIPLGAYELVTIVLEMSPAG